VKTTRIVLLTLSLCLAAVLLLSSDRELASRVVPPAQAGATLSDRKAVEELNRRFIEGCRKFDPDATAALWAEDGVDLLPGMEPMRGRAAIAKWLHGLGAQMKGVKILQCDVDWRQVEMIGDLAYEWGINTQTISLPDHPEPVKNRGKITLVLRKQPDASWKVVLESWNGNPQPKS
jgi:uncharacterized protein (TIGR02246 family)